MRLENRACYELHLSVLQRWKAHHCGKFARSLKAKRKEALTLWSLPVTTSFLKMCVFILLGSLLSQIQAWVPTCVNLKHFWRSTEDHNEPLCIFNQEREKERQKEKPPMSWVKRNHPKLQNRTLLIYLFIYLFIYLVHSRLNIWTSMASLFRNRPLSSQIVHLIWGICRPFRDTVISHMMLMFPKISKG